MANKLAIAIIQARMSSTRLPGKVLLPLKGKPIIHHIIDRAKSCKNVGKVVVATSIENSDSPLVKYCQENNIEYYIIKSQKRKIVKKSYADNFTK